MTTASGQFVIFHGSTAGEPDLFEPDGWYFEPATGLNLEVYSTAFGSEEAARAAAEAWEAEQEAEQEWRAEQQAEAAEHGQDERRWEAYMDAQVAEYQREAYRAGQ